MSKAQEIADSLSPKKEAALLALPMLECLFEETLWEGSCRANYSVDGLTHWVSKPYHGGLRVTTPLGEQVIKLLQERDT